MSDALIDWLFKIGLVLVLAGGVGGWYYWNVSRPATKLAELTVKYEERGTQLDEAVRINGEKDVTIETLREQARISSATTAKISKDCTIVAVGLTKALNEQNKQEPSAKIEGHGPTAMDEFYHKHYAGE